MKKLFFILAICLCNISLLYCEEDVQVLMFNAQKGDTRSQYMLGQMYQYEGNREQTIYWWKLAAQKEGEWAQMAQYNLGTEYLVKGEYLVDGNEYFKEAFILLKKAAESGYARALPHLGAMYELGLGTEKDYRKAYETYKKYEEAHMSNDETAWARLRLALLCLNDGFNENEAADWFYRAAQTGEYPDMAWETYWTTHGYNDAILWYTDMAKKGYSWAQAYLGIMLKYKKDDENSFYWLQKAAEQGVAYAQFELAEKYIDPFGTKKDETQGLYWLQKAVKQGDIKAQFILGLIYYQGRYGITSIPKDDSQAFSLFSKIAKFNSDTLKSVLGGDDYARFVFALGKMYYYGQGTEQDYSRAFYWLRQYPENDLEYIDKPFVMLGDMYYNGWGVEQNFQRALYNYLEASEREGEYYYAVQYQIGRMYYNGHGVKQDYNEAFSKFKLAAENGISSAQLLLGYMLETGQGINQDFPRALYWYNKAAEDGNIEALYRIGLMYEEGTGVGKSFPIAMAWYKKAADKGHSEAKQKYNELASLGFAENNEIQNGFVPEIEDVDINIPQTNIKNTNTFVLIIANENYDESEQISHVEYALNDGKIFRQYCERTLGIPATNILESYDATYGKFRKQFNLLRDRVQGHPDANVILYYSGHGVPDEANHTSYILPVDGSASDLSTCFKLDAIYNQLGELPISRIVVFIDACFSGTNRGSGLIASNARGVALKAVPGKPKGNMVVFSAAQGNETAWPYSDKEHGMFTYFLLKKLQQSNGEVSLQDLGDYITTNVQEQSLISNNKKQTPNVEPAAAVTDSWQNWKLK